MESGAKFPSALRAQLARMTQNFVDRDDDDEFDDESSSLRKARPTTAAGFEENEFKLERNGKMIRIDEDPGHRLHYGATIWRCCRFLCDYFDERPLGFYDQKRVLEVGAGTGLAGLSIAALGAKVTLTDTMMALPLIRHNLNLNSSLSNNVQITELEWYDAPKYIADFSPPFDFIIASDVIYNATAHRALVNIISLLSDNSTIVYVAYQERGVPGSQENFFKVMKEKGFTITQEFTKNEDGGEDGTLILHVLLLSKSN